MRFPERTIKAMKGETGLPLWSFAFYPAALLYSVAVRARAWLYRLGVLRSLSLPCRVICVGNITAGGTGKTPFVIYLARLLQGTGRSVAVLTRGYGGRLEGRAAVVSDGRAALLDAYEAGDEALVMAESLGGIPVVMGADRYEAGMLAVERFNPDAVILDDGYQHLALKRDLNILLMDAARPFGNGHTLPLGYLREPRSAVKRADAVVFTSTGGFPGNTPSLGPGIPVLKALRTPRSLRSLATGVESGLGVLSGKAVVAVAAIADPASFSLILQKLNANIVKSFFYRDHHGYSQGDAAEITAAARGAGADFIVTTEKDAVKLARLGGLPENTAALRIGMEPEEGEVLLMGLLERLFDKAKGPGLK